MSTGTNNDSGGTSKVVPLGTGKQSSNAWLGISDRIERGTSGSRNTLSAAKYGGDRQRGVLFKGKSASSPNAEMNSGNKEKDSSGEDQFKSAGQPMGTYGSRENMTIGGDKNVGKLVGKGAGATKSASGKDQLDPGKVMPGLELLKGTSDGDKNMARSLKGIGGKTGNKRSKE